MGLSLRGPQKQGADVLDEGVMTRAVVARYAAEDGLDGNAEAAKVLPARRHLWRLCETYVPHLLAAALRARLSTADQTGRGGVRELRRALADWLDPPPACAHCGRLLSPDLLAANPAGLPCPTRVAATGKPHKTGAGKSRRLLVCAPPRGPRASYGTIARPGPGRASGLARCGTLALFAPTILDPACSASVKMLKHGGASAYDLVVDRDARILFAVTEIVSDTTLNDARAPTRPRWVTGPRGLDHPILGESDLGRETHQTPELTSAVDGKDGTVIPIASHATDGHGQGAVGGEFASHDDYHNSTSDDAKRLAEQARIAALILTARATFDRTLDRAVRANARLALKTQLKYFSPKGSITRADLVQAAMMGLRRALLDYDPNFTPAGKKSGVKISSYAIGWIHQRMGEEFAERDVVAVPQWAVALRRTVADMGISPGHLLAQVLAVSEARGLPVTEKTGNPCAALAAALVDSIEHAWPASDSPTLQSLAHSRVLAAANAKPPKSKKPVTDEHSREQVAAVVADILGLECTGGAFLTALRLGAPPRFVPVSTGGERDDDAGGDDAGSTNSGLEHLHARPDGEDEEDAAIAEAEDRRNMGRLLDALAALRTTDPEAAEVVRRRHGLDAAGDEETLEQIGERLHSTGRELCREAVRVAYKRGVKAMQSLAGVSSLPLLEAPAAPLLTDDPDDIPGPSRQRHSAFRPLRPAVVRVILAAPPVTNDNAPGDPEAWTAAAMVF